jgi:hypothetical protein
MAMELQARAASSRCDTLPRQRGGRDDHQEITFDNDAIAQA